MPDEREWATIEQALEDLAADARPKTTEVIVALIKRHAPDVTDAHADTLARAIMAEVNGRKDLTSDNDDGA